MMAMLGQWLGFDSAASNPRHPSPSRPSPGGIVISEKKKTPSPSTDASAQLRKTKSDELLRDFEVMGFLGSVDERLKEQGTLLSRADLDRLQTLHAQACADECGVLSDIIEHFEMENDKLRHRLAVVASPSSAAADPSWAQRNALVC